MKIKFRWLQALLVTFLAVLCLTSCKDEKVELVDTFYQCTTVRTKCADGVNYNHTIETYELELYSDSTYVITYAQTNAFTSLDMTYGRIIKSSGTYTISNESEETNTYELAMPTHVTLAAHSRSNIHTYADSANWNEGNAAEGIDPGLNYKLYDYAQLETYETADEFIAHFGKKYTVVTNNSLDSMVVTVVDGSQVEIPLLG